VGVINVLVEEMTSTKKLKVFVADDSAFIRERLPDMLSELSGVEVIGQAEDGTMALASIRELNPDVVIMDIRMPEMSGLDVLKELQKDKLRPIIMVMTNYPYAQYREKCQALGANYFFDKSKDFDRLFVALQKLNRAHRQGNHSRKKSRFEI
jgi:DNA-binding NarL/FixJ family response regulator